MNSLLVTEIQPVAAKTVAAPRNKAYLWLGCLIVGYIGVYLCRKNFSVAIPLLQQEFQVSRGEIGWIASYSTLAYALGKFLFGAMVDRVGGRRAYLATLLLVSALGFAGGVAPSLFLVGVFYSLNRFVGAAGWPAMVKMTPDWFSGRQLPFALALLSLSFVVGGACASLLAGQVAEWSNNNWRMVMAAPSLVLLIFAGINAWFLPAGERHKEKGKLRPKFDWEDLWSVFRVPHFWIICGLSFTLTLLRETFNTWTVDFIKTEAGSDISSRIAAFLSTTFDIFGALGILVVGWFYGRISNQARQWFIFSTLALLALILFNLPNFFQIGLWTVTAAIGLIGFLTYGPYSLLAGTLSVQVRGAKSAGTVSGMVDGVGYFAGILAGAQFGQIVDAGGYRLGFQLLAFLAAASAVLCLSLYRSLGRRPVEETVI